MIESRTLLINFFFKINYIIYCISVYVVLLCMFFTNINLDHFKDILMTDTVDNPVI